MSTRILLYDVGKSIYYNKLSKNPRVDNVQLVVSPDDIWSALDDSDNGYDAIITDLVVLPEAVSLQGTKAVLEVDGFAHISELVEHYPDIPVVVLSRFWHIDNVIAAYQAGARWFVRRVGLPDARFISGLLSVIDGAQVMPYDFDELSVNRIRCALDPMLKDTSITDQVLIFELLRGSSTAEVINAFGWKTPQQLYNRVSLIMSNTGFHSRKDLLKHCRAIGLVGVAIDPS